MFILTIVILLVYKLFLAGKDALSYLLKEQHNEHIKTKNRIKRWHRDGVALDFLFTIVLAWATGNWVEVFVVSLLVRLAVYDIAFNHWAKLNVHYLGSTAIWDKIFIKIFGVNGAVKKSLFFLSILILWGILDIFI